MSEHTIPETTEPGPGVFLVRRWLSLLLRQQENYKQYLQLLEREKEALAQKNFSKLEKYIRQEDCLVKGIRAVDKVTGPLSRQFMEEHSQAKDLLKQYGIPDLQQALQGMQRQILAGIAENKDALEKCSQATQKELKQVRKNRTHRVFFNRPAAPTYIDIAG